MRAAACLSAVMAGLDPAIQAPRSESFFRVCATRAASLDGRVKPGHDARQMVGVTGNSTP